MALLGVELVEVVLGQLHLGAVQHGEAHANEDVFQLIQGQVHGVLVPQLHLTAGDGHIQSLILQALFQSLGFQLSRGGLDGRLQGGTDLIGQLAHGGPLLGGQLAHHFQNGGELALFAQILDAQTVQFSGGLGLLKGGQRLRTDLC